MRIISRIDVKNDFVIKGIHLEGLRKVGRPNDLAKKYFLQGVDEILFMDAVASLYERNNLFYIVEKAAEEVFVPITVGGGLRTLEDIHRALEVGADKVALNTAAVKKPEFIAQAAERFGSQCVVGSIEAKSNPTMPSGWEVYIDTGREKTGLDVIQWAARLEELGCGEILLTSIDKEGLKKGFDKDLFLKVNAATTRPVILSGGLGAIEHVNAISKEIAPSGIAVASVLHYDLMDVGEIRSGIAPEAEGARR